MVSPLPELVTLAQAKKHLKIVNDAENDDIYLKLEQATYLCLEYIWRDDDDWVDTMASWTKDTVPRSVQAAVLTQLGELYRFRGDDDVKTQPDREAGFLAPMVKAYLHRFRDPAIA